MDDLIQSAMVHLIRNEPFFANMLMNMTRNYTTDLPTLGVNVTNTVNLHINPFFWKSLNLVEQVDVLKHECYHLLNNHFARFIDLEPEMFTEGKRSLKDVVEDITNANTLNVAADLAINEYLPNLPKKINMFDEKGEIVCEPDQIPDPKTGQPIKNPNAGKPLEGTLLFVEDLIKACPKGNIERLKNLEYYYGFLKKEQQKNGGNQNIQVIMQPGKGQGKGDGKGGKSVTLDDHSLWGKGDQNADAITEKIKGMVSKAVEETGGKEAGEIPADVLQLIDALSHKPRDWRSDLQKFVSRMIEIQVKPSRKARNRRYGIIQPGYRKYPKLLLALGIDTSGSMPDEYISQIYAEVGRIYNNNVKVIVIECDAAVQAVFEYDPRRKIKCHGRGGTSFVPAFEEASKMEIDGMIYFTDGEDWGDDLKKPKFQVMWALMPNCDVRYKWGRKTWIEIEKKNK